jgi:filamentous hemagglutinin family protein
MPQKRLAIAIACFTSACFIANHAQAQPITPDGTTTTTINTTGLDTTITNGTAAGTNLFHSFQRFDIPTGGSATFDLVNTPAITTIFSRVTGGSVSNIDGLIRTTNSTTPVSLFLMNPAGILFGPNASLNIGGSFIGTTANSIKFADGTEFSATNPLTSPLLTVSVPIGLQMGQNPGEIRVQGKAATLNLGFFDLVKASNGGLQVQPGQTLALVGGEMNLDGAILATQGGQIKLGSVASEGMVAIATNSHGLTLDYSNLNNFGDIRLTQRSRVDASGNRGGNVQVQARQLLMSEASVIAANTSGNGGGGSLTIKATERVQLTGSSRNTTSLSAGVFPTATSQGGDIWIETPQLNLINGGQVGSGVFGTGNAGNLTIHASDIEVSGMTTDPKTRRFASGIFTTVQNPSQGPVTGKGGNISIETGRLLVAGGGRVSASTAGKGDGGNIAIRANQVEVRDAIADGAGILGGIIVSVAGTGTGKGGNLKLSADQLQIRNGGQVSAETLGKGDAGDLFINTRSLTIDGKSANGLFPSRLTASSITDFAAGSIQVKTQDLQVANGAEISVSSRGLGDAGNLTIYAANTLRLDNLASIRAEVGNGSQGNIVIDANALLLRQGSQISTNSTGLATGGNITIKAPIIAGFENSDIIANAVQGRGGNINITTQGIFGLKFRNTLTPRTDPTNDITVSSQFNVNGTVQISTPGIAPDSGIVHLAADFTDPSQQIATGCAGDDGSSFIATGRGGVPVNPMAEVRRDRPWSDIRDLSEFRKQDNSASLTSHTSHPTPLIEANAIRRNADGSFELIANHAAHMPHWATCSK